jgi:hypothetical protein
MSEAAPDVVAELRQLRERLDRVEAELEIARAMARYGPAVDSGSAEVAAALWADDGSYDAGISVMPSASAIAHMVRTDPHQSYIHRGCAHLVGPPHITIDGDQATAITHSQLLFWDPETTSYRAWRVTANVWTWRREAAGWKVTSRVDRPLDGSDEARELFRDALSPGPLAPPR